MQTGRPNGKTETSSDMLTPSNQLLPALQEDSIPSASANNKPDEDNNDLIDDEAEESGESSDDSGEDLDSNKENSSGYSDMEISDEEVTKAGLNRA
ncbi:hypothetical protein VNI00_005226 [Paramarasmius palmivorus]|uniref:Uncharacterized protein n=1 Tax=Paramarasmius palmivorus TaxID=297713 RepID=A0AAW0DIZ3_9AGAR